MEKLYIKKKQMTKIADCTRTKIAIRLNYIRAYVF